MSVDKVSEKSMDYAEILNAQFFYINAGEPISERDLVAWLMPLVAAMKFGSARDKTEIEGRIGGIKLAFKDHPKFLFTAEMQAKILKTYDYFPSVAEIWRLMEKQFDQYQRGKTIFNRLLGRPFGDLLPSAGQAHIDAISSNRPRPENFVPTVYIVPNDIDENAEIRVKNSN